MPTCNRRRFLKAAGALSLGASFAPSWAAAADPEAPAGTQRPLPPGSAASKEARQMQIGILIGTFSGPTLEARLDAVKACGIDCVQLSMDCAGLPLMPERIAPELAARIRRAAAARAITIASVQGTFNMSHPDAEHRRAGLRGLQVLTAACAGLGTSMIHLCTGTRDRQNMWRRHADNDSPAAWRDMAACVREAAEIARPAGVVLGFEPEVNNVVDSAQKARRLMDEIGSPHLKVTMDAANLFHAGELARMDEILEQAFALVGKDIVMAHAKDLSHDGDAGHEAAGHGRLDYDRYISLLKAYGFSGPLLLHGLSEAQVPGCVAFLRRKLARRPPAA
ncbi:MAG: sugar phosphate isomerase/epimerase family protein [Thermoguttaceae bacterium]|jgi:sugar phosphate isomerase/epimerase